MKKRAVGALVLVAIGIMLPLLLVRCFSGEGDNGDDMRVYEVAPDGQTRPAGAAPNGSDEAGGAAAEVDGQTAVAPSAEQPSEAPQMPEAVSPSSGSAIPASEPATNAAAGSSASGSASTAQPNGSNASASDLRRRDSVGSGWVVQVASFGEEGNAQRLAEQLSGQYEAYYRSGEVNGRTYYRVRVGPFESEGSARSAAARLRSEGRATLVQRAD